MIVNRTDSDNNATFAARPAVKWDEVLGTHQTREEFEKQLNTEAKQAATNSPLFKALSIGAMLTFTAIAAMSCFPDYADAASTNPIVECDELLKGRYVAHRGQGLTDTEFGKVMLEDLVYKGEKPVKVCLIDLEKHPVHLSSWEGGKGYAFARVGGYMVRYTPKDGIK